MDTVLDNLDRELINYLHSGFPLCRDPYAQIGAALHQSETVILQRLSRLLEIGALTRLGPLYQIERAGGAFSLCAMAVPEARFEAVAEQVNALPEVAHNYQRNHRLNMWFVLATTNLQRQTEVLQYIETETGLPVFNFPKQHEFFVELRLPA